MGRPKGAKDLRPRKRTYGYQRPDLARTLEPTAQDICWMAGFYEGDGSCKGDGGTSYVSVGQKDRWVLDKCVQLFGGSVSPRGDIYWGWNLCGSRARGLLMSMYELLSPRRQQQVRLALGIE